MVRLESEATEDPTVYYSYLVIIQVIYVIKLGLKLH